MGRWSKCDFSIFFAIQCFLNCYYLCIVNSLHHRPLCVDSPTSLQMLQPALLWCQSWTHFDPLMFYIEYFEIGEETYASKSFLHSVLHDWTKVLVVSNLRKGLFSDFRQSNEGWQRGLRLIFFLAVLPTCTIGCENVSRPYE